MLVAGAGGAVAGALVDVLGAGHWRAVTVAVVVAAVAVLVESVLAAPWPRRPQWPVGEAPRSPGARNDLVELAAGVDLRVGSIDPQSLADVQRMVRRQLRTHGVDLDDPAGRVVAERLIGRPAIDVLLHRGDLLRPRGAGFDPLRDAAAVVRAVDAVSALGEPGAAGREPTEGIGRSTGTERGAHG